MQRRLETTVDLLDALQERYGWDSDRQIAEGLDIPQTTVSSWRRGRSYPTEVHAIAIARALEIPPALVLVIAAADRTDDRDARAEWQKMLRQIARTGFGVLAAVAVATAHYSPSGKTSAHGLYIPSNRRRRVATAA